MGKAVHIRLMGDNPEEVRRVTAMLAQLPGIAFTGTAPNRRGSGLRAYGAVAVPSSMPPSYRLDDLLAGVTDANRHGEFPTIGKADDPPATGRGVRGRRAR